MKKSILTIAISVYIVSITYFLGSVFLSGAKFYLFDIVWRVCTIACVILLGRFNPKISRRQYGILFCLFGIEGIAYIFFSSIPLYRIVISVAFAPILEEILFRGWVIDHIEGTQKDKIIFSSLFFALYHLKNARVLTLGSLLYQVVYAGLFIGPILAWTRLKYDSIFPALTLHSINNSLADIGTTRIFPFLMGRRKGFV